MKEHNTFLNAFIGHSLLHPSWLLCVYQRMFQSENKALMREGVCHLLQLQVLKQPEFAVAFSQVQYLASNLFYFVSTWLTILSSWQFVIGPFLDVLSETSLYQR